MSNQISSIELSIIIINYNLAEEIENCLTSLIKNADIINYEVIVVDNNSTDRNILETEKKFKDNNIRFYYLDQNLGFGKGCNYGFSKSCGKYICFLNPDTLILEPVFSPIIKLFENNSKAGIIGPKQQTKGPFLDFSAGFYPNIVFEFFNLFGLGVYFEAFIVSLYTKLKKSDCLRVDWILGAAIFIRSELFKELNGFDKDYFMFFEETDLCKRVRNKDYKIVYYHKLKIHHIGSVSGKKNYCLYTKRIYTSKYVFISKHFSSFNRLVMKSFYYAQICSQIILWILLFPLNKQKSRQKLNAFIYLLNPKNKFKY